MPLNLWGERNFEEVTRHFGKTIAPFDEILHRVDLSCAKIGILTKRRARINDELYVAINDTLIKIGFIEFDEDWFPFRFDSSKIFYEDEYGRDVVMDNNEEEAAPDAVMGEKEQMEDHEPEEGEIPPEPINDNESETVVAESMEGGENNNSETTGVSESPIKQKSPLTEVENGETLC
ncbi:hypothetical protein LXL04_023087 [Taraxacum kok-saghyz]